MESHLSHVTERTEDDDPEENAPLFEGIAPSTSDDELNQPPPSLPTASCRFRFDTMLVPCICQVIAFAFSIALMALFAVRMRRFPYHRPHHSIPLSMVVIDVVMQPIAVFIYSLTLCFKITYHIERRPSDKSIRLPQLSKKNPHKARKVMKIILVLLWVVVVTLLIAAVSMDADNGVAWWKEILLKVKTQVIGWISVGFHILAALSFWLLPKKIVTININAVRPAVSCQSRPTVTAPGREGVETTGEPLMGMSRQQNLTRQEQPIGIA